MKGLRLGIVVGSENSMDSKQWMNSVFIQNEKAFHFNWMKMELMKVEIITIDNNDNNDNNDNRWSKSK